MWACSKCEEQVEDSFDVCWNCGTSAQGVEDPDFEQESDPYSDDIARSALPELTVRCKPLNFFSWDFFLENNSHEATLQWNFLNEEGTISIDGVPHEVCKHGVFSGQWTLEREGKSLLSATKVSALTREFRMEAPEGTLSLEALSFFGQGFQITHSGKLLATIKPAHWLTTRSTIELKTSEMEFTTICFSFWLVVLIWRRQSASNS